MEGGNDVVANQEKKREKRVIFSKEENKLLMASFALNQCPAINEKARLANIIRVTNPLVNMVKISKWFDHKRQRPSKMKPRKKRNLALLPLTSSRVSCLEKSYKTSKWVSDMDRQKLMEETGLAESQIKDWFIRRRKSDSTLESQVTAPSRATTIVNTNPRLFWVNKDTGKLEWKTIEEGEDCAVYHKLYISLFDIVKKEDAQGKMAKTAVGYTGMDNAISAAKLNWLDIKKAIKNILSLGIFALIKACSYRNDVVEDGLEEVPETAKFLGIYTPIETVAKGKASKEQIIELFKWWFRLRLLALGTLRPRECLDILYPFAEYLESVVLQYLEHMAPVTRRWIILSAPQMKAYIKDKSAATFPGVDDKLVTRFKCIELWSHDPALF
ncbi:uncharacterized protein LOC118439011 [Folsomia candida]|uniref:uncharacterized protein LOC118439011 n=1 Tax=Folsomia candida TaxID=158441 RepID=UPI001604A9B0|nr:uncharacterized protein LOC118439011 [Folsomia candida]XP_035716468.1 uncharacterized protein LOC118439011 [Folsomia candida]